MISKMRINDHLEQYKKLQVPMKYNDRIQYIVNGVPIPTDNYLKHYDTALKVLYVGRGTEEKRVHIIAAMAERAATKKLPVEFWFMGDVKDAIPINELKYCKLLGHMSDPIAIANIYNQSHLVIITSYTEGFPMVIEEGMARGCAVMATPVGDIPVHVGVENGLLFSEVNNEDRIIEEGIAFLSLLCKDRSILKNMSERNTAYAKQQFSLDTFSQQYNKLFKALRQKH